MNPSQEYWAKTESEKIFKKKKEWRKLEAKKPIEEKIKDLVKIQEIAIPLHPELKEYGLPWNI